MPANDHDPIQGPSTPERLPTPEARARAARRGQVWTWMLGLIVAAITGLWIAGAVAWFLMESSEEERLPLAARPTATPPMAALNLARSVAPTPDVPPDSPLEDAAPDTAASPVRAPAPDATPATPPAPPPLWIPSQGARIGFVGIDAEPRWGAGFAFSPVAHVIAVDSQSALAGFICMGDAVIAVNSAGLEGLNDMAITRALELALFDTPQAALQIAPADGGAPIRLVWSAAAPASPSGGPSAPAAARCPRP